MIRGDLHAVRRMLDKRGWASARDHYGHTPLHKSVMANQVGREGGSQSMWFSPYVDIMAFCRRML